MSMGMKTGRRCFCSDGSTLVEDDEVPPAAADATVEDAAVFVDWVAADRRRTGWETYLLNFPPFLARFTLGTGSSLRLKMSMAELLLVSLWDCWVSSGNFIMRLRVWFAPVLRNLEEVDALFLPLMKQFEAGAFVLDAVEFEEVRPFANVLE